eukprot:GFYU01042074.1.p1 GENE.GFYU01042074.1~~GFYU01042074.1.p1  ORF type:complete len:182 (+),score=54.68 GFYU01042074.1:2-547(+)
MFAKCGDNPGRARALIEIAGSCWGQYLAKKEANKLTEGRAALDDAKKLLNDSGDPTKLAANWAYHDAIYYRLTGDALKCEELLNKAGDLAHEIAGGACSLQARTYMSKYNLHSSRGDRAKAYQNVVIAAKMWAETEGPDHPDTKRAESALAQPEYDEFRQNKGDMDVGSLVRRSSSGFLKI